MTSSRKYRLRSIGVLKSILLPPNNRHSSSSMSARRKNPHEIVRLELNQHIDVAELGETIGENRAEECELPDTVALADLGDLRLGDLDVCNHHPLFSMAREAHACRKVLAADQSSSATRRICRSSHSPRNECARRSKPPPRSSQAATFGMVRDVSLRRYRCLVRSRRTRPPPRQVQYGPLDERAPMRRWMRRDRQA